MKNICIESRVNNFEEVFSGHKGHGKIVKIDDELYVTSCIYILLYYSTIF